MWGALGTQPGKRLAGRADGVNPRCATLPDPSPGVAGGGAVFSCALGHRSLWAGATVCLGSSSLLPSPPGLLPRALPVCTSLCPQVTAGPRHPGEQHNLPLSLPPARWKPGPSLTRPPGLAAFVSSGSLPFLLSAHLAPAPAGAQSHEGFLRPLPPPAAPHSLSCSLPIHLSPPSPLCVHPSVTASPGPLPPSHARRSLSPWLSSLAGLRAPSLLQPNKDCLLPLALPSFFLFPDILSALLFLLSLVSLAPPQLMGEGGDSGVPAPSP